MNYKTVITLISILVYLILIPISFFTGITGFIPDIVVFMLLPVVLNWLYDVLHLNPITFSLLNLGPLPHALGIFGWYGSSPFPFQWDHFTHLAGLFPVALAFTIFFAQWMEDRFFTRKNLILIISVFLLASGVGAMIELSEFLGYLSLGFGDGGFQFGPGDGTDAAAINDIGGGWINTGWDLIYNTIAVVLGIIVGLLWHPSKEYEGVAG